MADMECTHEGLFRNVHGVYECTEPGCDFTFAVPEYDKLRARIAQLEGEPNAPPIAAPAFIVRAAKPGDVVFLTLQKEVSAEQHKRLLSHFQLYTANLGIKFVVLGPEFAPVEVEARAGDLTHTTRGAEATVALQEKADSRARKIHLLRAGIGRILNMACEAGTESGDTAIEAECKTLLDIKSDDEAQISASPG